MSQRPTLAAVTQRPITAASLVILGGSRYDRAKSILHEVFNKRFRTTGEVGDLFFAAHPPVILSTSLDVSLLMATSNIHGAIKESCNKSRCRRPRPHLLQRSDQPGLDFYSLSLLFFVWNYSCSYIKGSTLFST